MKRWIIALLFVFACLPVVTIKAAPPQTYVHLDYQTSAAVDGYYDLDDGSFVNIPGIGVWDYSNKIQIPKNVGKLYFSGWHTHFVLFYNNDTYIGFYYEDEYVSGLTSWAVESEEKILGTYNYGGDIEHVLDVPTNATHIMLQTCSSVSGELLGYIDPLPIAFNEVSKPLIYYPAPADAASNITFSLMPALMIVIVIAGLAGGLIMITKKSR